MNDAATLSADALGPPERLHPLYLVIGLGKSLRNAWGMVAAVAVFASQRQWWLVAMIIGGFSALSVGSLLLRWLKLEYRVGPHELRIDSGFLNRTSRAIPFDRVTDIDLEQGPLHRVLGLARVRLETGGSAGGSGEDGVLDAVSLTRANALREHIRARRGGAPPAAATVEDASPIFAMGRRRVAIAGLFNFSLAVIAGLFGLSQTIGDAVGFDPFSPRFWNEAFDRFGPVQQIAMAHQLIAIFGGSILLVLLGIGTGLVRTTLREHGFRLDRTEAGLRRRRGLLTLTDVSIPARRVQAAMFVNGPARGAFGWWQLKLQSLAKDGARGDHVVAPLAHEAEAAAILASLGWPAAPSSDQWRRVRRGYVTSRALAVGPIATLPLIVPFTGGAGLTVIAALPFLGIAGLLWLAATPFLVAGRWLSWRHTRYALDGGNLFVETGWWRHRRSIIPARKVQSVDIAENFWGRMFGICAVKLGVAGGSGFSDHHVPALSRADAERLRARLLAA